MNFQMHVIDLYNRVDLGTKIVMLSNHEDVATAAASLVPAQFFALRSNDLRTSYID